MDGIIFVRRRRLSVEILPTILRGDPAETSSKIGYFGEGGFRRIRRRIGGRRISDGETRLN